MSISMYERQSIDVTYHMVSLLIVQYIRVLLLAMILVTSCYASTNDTELLVHLEGLIDSADWKQLELQTTIILSDGVYMSILLLLPIN